MRALPFREWMTLLVSLYQGCLAQVYAAGLIHQLLKKIVLEAYPSISSSSLASHYNSADACNGKGAIAPAITINEPIAVIPTGTNASSDIGSGSIPGSALISPSATSSATVSPPPNATITTTTSTVPTTSSLSRAGSLPSLRRSLLDADGAKAAQDPDGLEDYDGLLDATESAIATLPSDYDGDLSQLDAPAQGAINGAKGGGDQEDQKLASMRVEAASATSSSSVNVVVEEELRALIQSSSRAVGDLCHQMFVRCAKLLVARTRDGVDATIPVSKYVE